MYGSMYSDYRGGIYIYIYIYTYHGTHTFDVTRKNVRETEMTYDIQIREIKLRHKIFNMVLHMDWDT